MWDKTINWYSLSFAHKWLKGEISPTVHSSEHDDIDNILNWCKDWVNGACKKSHQKIMEIYVTELLKLEQDDVKWKIKKLLTEFPEHDDLIKSIVQINVSSPKKSLLINQKVKKWQLNISFAAN